MVQRLPEKEKTRLKTKEKGENAQAEASLWLHRTLRPMDARNPADDPTRGVPLRKSDVEVPDWWEAAVGSEFSLLDSFLSSLELHPYQLAGYDDLSDSSGNPFLAVDPGLKHGFNRYCKKIRDKIRLRAKIKLDAGYPESIKDSRIKDMFDVIVDMSSVGRTFTPDIFVHQCCQRSLHIFSVMRCIKDSWIKEMFDVIVDMSMCRENFYTQTH